MDWKNSRIDAFFEQALQEDKAAGDITTNFAIEPDLRATATILARQDLVAAGMEAVPRILQVYARLDRRPQVQTRFEVASYPDVFDGARVQDGKVLAVIHHNAQVLLSCERVILNLLQHLSGIATQTRKYADAVRGTQAKVLDTRKTTPGMRVLEKYAVVCGGGVNHRLDLSAGILIKNNHISLGGGVAAVLKRTLERPHKGQLVQVEARTPQEIEDALSNGAEGILLDNMTPDEVRKSVLRIREFSRDHENRWIPIEASGGIVLENIRFYADTGVDFISVGALTHSAPAVDISMRIEAEKH